MNSVRLPGRYLAVQLSSRERSLQHLLIALGKILSALRATFSIVLLGRADDQRWLERRAGLLSLLRKTSMSDFLDIMEGSAGVVSVDSFAAHIGLTYSRVVAVLMVEPYSQEISYPDNNPHLRLFLGCDGVEEVVTEFFHNASPRASTLKSRYVRV